MPRRTRVEVAMRRAAIWSALNAVHYGGGPLREVRAARARSAAPAAADAPLRAVA